MGIQKFMSDQHVEMFYEYSPKIAQLVDHICPRYIITSVGKDVFYQRPVYINNAGFSTRFVSLSSMPNPKSKDTFKQKYVHAFSIKPLIHLQESELREKELEGIKNAHKNEVKDIKLNNEMNLIDIRSQNEQRLIQENENRKRDNQTIYIFAVIIFEKPI